MYDTVLEEALRKIEDRLISWGLPREAAADLINHSDTFVNYGKDSWIVFQQRASADVLFWICTGLVKIYWPGADDSRLLLRIAGPGDLIGHLNLVTANGDASQMFEAQAVGKVTVMLLTRERVQRLLEGLDQATLARLLENLNNHWSETVRWYITFLGLSFRQRLEVVLDDLAKRVGVPDKRGILLIPKLGHSDLAELIRSSRPMVSRLINEMVSEGRLAREGKQYLLPHRDQIAASTASVFRNSLGRGSGRLSSVRLTGNVRQDAPKVAPIPARLQRPTSK